MRIEGEVRFSEISAPFDDATVIVLVEDASRADAAAKTIVERRLTGISRTPDNHDPVPFLIDLPASKRVSCYSLRVHVSLKSTDEIAVGDYVSTQSYPLKDDSSRVLMFVHPVR